MNITKTISTAGVGLAIIGGSMLAVNMASAHGNDNRSELVDRLATELNVDSEQVQGVFDSMREEREAKQDEHLASLVTDGTLTQEQADALKTKRAEMHSARQALKDRDLTKEEIKTEMETAREAFRAWAEEQGINLDDIKPEDQGKHKGEFGRRHGHGRPQ